MQRADGLRCHRGSKGQALSNHTVFAQMITTEKGDGAIATRKVQTAHVAFRIMLPTASSWSEADEQGDIPHPQLLHKMTLMIPCKLSHR